ncbi:glycosyltransferase family 4 protein [Chloroflexota bacterium]
MSRQPWPVAYVLQSFPLLTETFVYREVWGLERRGLQVATFATWKPDIKTLSQEAKHLLENTTYVFPISWTRLIRAHLNSLGRHPLKYVGTLISVLTPRGESLRNRRRTFFHFCEAVYLAEEMRDQQIKHIHAHFCINAATIALVASRLLDISFSFTAHNILFTDRVILKEKIRAASFVVAISHFTREFLMRLVCDDPVGHKIHVVHCGISPDAFAPLDPKPANDIPTLLFVGQLCERKGASVLVEACKILVERGVHFRCVIVGEGPQKALVEDLVEQNALQEEIELAGTVFQERIQAYFQRADVFVLPCLTAGNGDVDGVPVSLMEAMAVEVAAVSTRVSGIPELIEDGVSGLLVPEQDPLALADALQRALEDDELRSRLGENGRRKIVQEFNIDISAGQLATLFEECVPTDEGLE